MLQDEEVVVPPCYHNATPTVLANNLNLDLDLDLVLDLDLDLDLDLSF